MYLSNGRLVTLVWCRCYSPHAHNFNIHVGILICKNFSNPCPYAYPDPCIHMAIPVWKILQMRIQDLISHMEIFPMCIWLVTELSPYAYGHCKNSRMHTRIMCNVIPICKWGSSSSLYTYWELSWSPYAYRDYVSCNPCMQTGISIIPVCIRDTGSDLDPHMHTGSMHRCANNATLDAQIMQWPIMFFCVCTQNGFWCAHSKSSGSTRDSRKDCWYFRIWSPYAYGDTHMRTGMKAKIAYGDSPHV
jgi:hypothetical protein